MWVFTRYGFVSIACANKPDGKIDESTVMVRARSRQHLESLKTRFPNTELGNAEILKSAGTDYEYRLVIPKAAWVAILSDLAMEQTWSNFKNEAARFDRTKRGSGRYLKALHRVWEIMFAVQADEER